MCCSDPYWLYRIYQDTIITVSEIEILLSDAFVEQAEVFERLQKGKGE